MDSRPLAVPISFPLSFRLEENKALHSSPPLSSVFWGWSSRRCHCRLNDLGSSSPERLRLYHLGYNKRQRSDSPTAHYVPCGPHQGTNDCPSSLSLALV